MAGLKTALVCLGILLASTFAILVAVPYFADTEKVETPFEIRVGKLYGVGVTVQYVVVEKQGEEFLTIQTFPGIRYRGAGYWSVTYDRKCGCVTKVHKYWNKNGADIYVSREDPEQQLVWFSSGKYAGNMPIEEARKYFEEGEAVLNEAREYLKDELPPRN